MLEKGEIIINEMMADDGPVAVHLVNVGTHDARTTRTRATTCRAAVCVRSRAKDAKLAKEQARKDRTERERGTEVTELMDGRVAKETSKSDWYGDIDTGPNGNKDEGKDKDKGNSENSILRRLRREGAHR